MTDVADLPAGTVTFLFTDLEGSTRLLQAHPEAYRDAVTRHHAPVGLTAAAAASAAALGAAGHLRKPFDRAELLALVRRLMAGPARGRRVSALGHGSVGGEPAGTGRERSGRLLGSERVRRAEGGQRGARTGGGVLHRRRGRRRKLVSVSTSLIAALLAYRIDRRGRAR